MSRAKGLMVVGTCSNAGKSLTVAALCRIYARRGVRVAPFKSQNMSLNAGVTAEGHEVARSICVQAEAAGIEPHVDMNPVLLKPEGGLRSQVILAGRPAGHLDAAHWTARKDAFWQVITESLERLRRRFDLVIFEGAGSPAEINLAAGDVANLRVAVHADVPALLVGDIDRGGVFASLYGTVALLDETQRGRIKGFVINKLRGDARLLGDGLEQLQRRAFGIPTVGVVPFLPGLDLPEEDSVALDSRDPSTVVGAADDGTQKVDIAVLRLAHVSNFDDFDPLAREPGVRLRWVSKVAELGAPDVVILPGSKTTIADLRRLRENGLADAVRAFAASGHGQVIGICGGFQMLGHSLEDVDGREEAPGTRQQGLGLLDLETRFAGDKRTRRVAGEITNGSLAGCGISGYEIHVGESARGPELRPLSRVRGGDGGQGLDGAISDDGRIWGTYVHGIFDDDTFRHAWLASLGRLGPGKILDREAAYERLADHFEAHLDMDALDRIIGRSEGTCSRAW